jgi:hypothetical protein
MVLLLVSTNNIAIGLVRVHKIRFRPTKIRFPLSNATRTEPYGKFTR